MVKATLHLVALDPSVVAVAGNTVLAGQLLVERCAGQGLADQHTLGGQASDVGGLVTSHTLFRMHAGKGHVAGKAIGVDVLVSGNQLARPHHQVRVHEARYRQHRQIDGQNDFEGAAHTQPQNKKMLTIWPSASTANTMKIGICTLRHCTMVLSATASQKTACSTSGLERPRN